MKTPTLLVACLLATVAGPALAAKLPSEKEKLRQQAEHVCYDDVQKLCNDSIPDEDKIKACMDRHHAQLSAPCAKAFDQGLGG